MPKTIVVARPDASDIVSRAGFTVNSLARAVRAYDPEGPSRATLHLVLGRPGLHGTDRRNAELVAQVVGVPATVMFTHPDGTEL